MGGKNKIVIADDNPVICSTLKDILIEKGYLVKTVKDGYELLAYLKNNSVDVIILDLLMPQKDGIEILSTVKSISPRSKIIIYTGFEKYRNSSYVVTTADKFFLKGDNPEGLLQLIEELTRPSTNPD